MDKEKDKNDLKTIKYSSVADMGLLDPEARLKSLSTRGSSVTVNYSMPLRRYYRGGVEIMRMAKTYKEAGQLEDAYIYYHRFMTLFIEKVQSHPEYNTMAAKDKAHNQALLREAFPIAEALKAKLLAKYKAEALRYLADAKKREKDEIERLERERILKLQEEEDRKNKLAAMAAMKASKAALIASISAAEEPERPQPSAPAFPIIGTEFDTSTIPAATDKKTPTIDRSTKPTPFTTDKQTLRDIVLPSRTMRDFLLLAFKNTSSNRETCGILAGKLERNKLLVTHLLIPQQTGTPDSCATESEEDIFDYQDQHNLITLGWIHTHPTQTAFLSSVDLHTHCAYQLMMAEAIAIVCAPKYDETGYFMLTPEYGLNFIASCRESGFHPHPTEPPLYTTAVHCKLSSTADIELVDFRRK